MLIKLMKKAVIFIDHRFIFYLLKTNIKLFFVLPLKVTQSIKG
jgi:hypothetical protein